MRQGNFQWDSKYPDKEVFLTDIKCDQLWVALLDGCIAGVAAITTDQDAAYADAEWDVNEEAIVIHRLAVDPTFQGKGVAAALMMQAEIVAKARRIFVLRVDTNTENPATQRLFPKLGYVQKGEIELALRPGQKFKCYEKRLA